MDPKNQPTVKQPEGSGFRSGFVALTGRPNAGKSTLINQLSGMDLAITSPKPQTTRTAIRAIVNRPNGQIILVDTPGLLQPRNRLGTFMADAIVRTVTDADIVLLIVDAEGESGKRGRRIPEQQLLDRLKAANKTVILVLNKVDVMTKEHLLPIIGEWSGRYPFAAIIPVSARTGDGVMVLEAELLQRLPEGPRYFPEDAVTDQTERVLAAELIREQILRHTHQEIPHGTAVVINAFEEEFADDDIGMEAPADVDEDDEDDEVDDAESDGGGSDESDDDETDEEADDDESEDDEADDESEDESDDEESDDEADDESEDESDADGHRRTLVRIDATILCEKDSHKGILIGKGGSMLKAIGTAARLQIEKMVDCRVYLELRVKVREDWQNRTGILRDLGYIRET